MLGPAFKEHCPRETQAPLRNTHNSYIYIFCKTKKLGEKRLSRTALKKSGYFFLMTYHAVIKSNEIKFTQTTWLNLRSTYNVERGEKEQSLLKL